MDEQRFENSAGGYGENGQRYPAVSDRAHRVVGKARERAYYMADERKGDLAERLDSFADELAKVGGGAGGEQVDKLAGKAADVIRRASSTLREHTSEELFERVEREVRARPGIVIAGCIALGFLGARLLKD
jgi:hypothetical protein